MFSSLFIGNLDGKAQIELITAPTEEPVTLDEAKNYMRVDIDDDNDLIELLISSATQQIQDFTNRQLVTATYDLFLDGFFPIVGRSAIELPIGNVQDITEINYIDINGDSQLWDSSNFEVDLNREIVQFRPVDRTDFPSTDTVYNAVTVRFVAGYGDAAAVPKGIKQIIFLMIQDAYEHREENSEIKLEMNKVFERLLWNFRLKDFY